MFYSLCLLQRKRREDYRIQVPLYTRGDELKNKTEKNKLVFNQCLGVHARKHQNNLFIALREGVKKSYGPQPQPKEAFYYKMQNVLC